MGLTSLSTQSLVEGEPELEATPQFFPTLDGEEVKGYGAFAFRKDDAALLQAFNAELAGLIGTEEHWRLVEPFGFGPDMAPDQHHGRALPELRITPRPRRGRRWRRCACRPSQPARAAGSTSRPSPPT